MSDKNVYKNAQAMAILGKAEKELRAIGVHCAVSAMSLPQGMTVSLHMAENSYAVIAAHVASTRGGMSAHAINTADEFESELASVLKDDLIRTSGKSV